MDLHKGSETPDICNEAAEQRMRTKELKKARKVQRRRSIEEYIEKKHQRQEMGELLELYGGELM